MITRVDFKPMLSHRRAPHEHCSCQHSSVCIAKPWLWPWGPFPSKLLQMRVSVPRLTRLLLYHMVFRFPNTLSETCVPEDQGLFHHSGLHLLSHTTSLSQYKAVPLSSLHLWRELPDCLVFLLPQMSCGLTTLTASSMPRKSVSLWRSCFQTKQQKRR